MNSWQRGLLRLGRWYAPKTLLECLPNSLVVGPRVYDADSEYSVRKAWLARGDAKNSSSNQAGEAARRADGVSPEAARQPRLGRSRRARPECPAPRSRAGPTACRRAEHPTVAEHASPAAHARSASSQAGEGVSACAASCCACCCACATFSPRGARAAPPGLCVYSGGFRLSSSAVAADQAPPQLAAPSFTTSF